MTTGRRLLMYLAQNDSGSRSRLVDATSSTRGRGPKRVPVYLEKARRDARCQAMKSGGRAAGAAQGRRLPRLSRGPARGDGRTMAGLKVQDALSSPYLCCETGKIGSLTLRVHAIA